MSATGKNPKTSGCARPTGGLVGEDAPEQSPGATPPRPVVRVGKKAPDFVAPTYQDGGFGAVQLSEFLGRWVLLCFYPGDFTFVWATEMAAVAARKAEFDKLRVAVLPMSVDSVFVHKMWVDLELSRMVRGGFPYPLLSDGGGKVGEVFGVYDPEAGVDLRGRFIIDPDGVVQAAETLTPPVGRNVAETLRQLQAFSLVRASAGREATPAGWRPGKKTLKPGPDLVGKVWKAWKVREAFK